MKYFKKQKARFVDFLERLDNEFSRLKQDIRREISLQEYYRKTSGYKRQEKPEKQPVGYTSYRSQRELKNEFNNRKISFK